MSLGLLGAFAAAVCYGAGSILQAIGSRSAPGGSRAGLDVAELVRRLARQRQYVAGLALDGVGFASSTLALRTLPLFVVQAAVASSVAVTALLAHQFLGVRLRRIEWLAIGGLGIGLVLLAASAEAEPALRPGSLMRLVLVLGVVVVALVGAAAGRAPDRYAATALAACSGLAFSGLGIAARVLVVPDPLWRLAFSPVAVSMLGYGALGLILYAAALQRGSVTAATAMLCAVETVLPASIGLALLGDRPRSGYAGVAAAGFLLAIGCALALARYAEVLPSDVRATI